MNNLTAFLLWSALAHNIQAWAPLSLRATTTTIRNRKSSDVPVSKKTASSSSTSIYATVIDNDSVAGAFLQEDSGSLASSDTAIFSPIPYSELTIGVVKETYEGENRVSQTPDSVKNLVTAGFTVVIQSGGR